MSEENPQTMKPVYKFEWSVVGVTDNDKSGDGDATQSLARRTDELVNDCRDFTETGIEKLAELGRADDECTVTLVGYKQI